jgi:ribonuclease HII
VARWSAVERSLRAEGARLIAGVDEVGRGPLAGPVFACAVIMPPGARAIPGVADSKKLGAAERERLAALIASRAVCVSLGAASVREIAACNIYQATALAMRRALRRLGEQPDAVLVDGKPIKTLGVPHRAFVGGDSRIYSIACASIVAKVARDRLMRSLAERHPGYGWEQNAGYGTPVHILALRERGLTAHHRGKFCEGILRNGEGARDLGTGEGRG